MHKKPAAGKKPGARLTPGSRSPSGRWSGRSRPHSVTEVLTRGRTLRQLRRTIPEQQHWAEWLRGRLPDELAGHLVSVVRKPPAPVPASAPVPSPAAPAAPAGRTAQLILFADSAAWCARLRYAVGALTGDIREHDAAIGPIQVRVLMNPPG